MATDLDLYRAAVVLIKEYGDEAEKIAAKRVVALEAEAEHEGAAAFRRIIEIILELRRTEPKAGEPTH
jgi:hypothetical protein